MNPTASRSLTILFYLINTVCCLRFIAIGDWGVTLPNTETTVKRRQAEVARAMNKWSAENGALDFVLSTGDNFYPRGVLTNDSERFRVSWKAVYDLEHLRGVPWYVALGNHDHLPGVDDRQLRQVEHGRLDPNWICPHPWHERTWPTGRTSLQVIVVDSTALKSAKHRPHEQHAWLKERLARSAADWKIVVGHHPVYSAGLNGPADGFLVRNLLPLLEKYGVDVALSGHDHALERIKRADGGGPDFVISGAGGKELYEENGQFTRGLLRAGLRLRFYRNENGFVAFQVRNNAMRVGFYDKDCQLLHNFTHWKGIGYRQMHSLDVQ